MTTLQPFWYSESNGEVRRVANILLALEYPQDGDSHVNDVDLRLVKKYARRGKLYSMELRNHIYRACI